MSTNRIVDWQERAQSVIESSFNCEAALQLAKEIKSSVTVGNISFRALQTVHILENIVRTDNPSDRQLADAKAAVRKLTKTLHKAGWA